MSKLVDVITYKFNKWCLNVEGMDKAEVFCGIKITGSEKFIDKQKQALKLLQEKDKINFRRVKIYIKEILMSISPDEGTFLAYSQTYLKGEKEAVEWDLKWMASCIVHEAVHGIIYKKLGKRRTHISSFRKERACARVQVRCLKRLGAPISDEKEYLNKIMAQRWWTFSYRLKETLKQIFKLFIDKEAKLDKVIASYTKAIEKTPHDAKAYYNRGIAHSKKGNLEQAILDFTKVIELDPACVNAYFSRGGTYYEKGELINAIADCAEGIKLKPDDAAAYSLRGSVYYEKGDFEHAILDYTQAIAIDPNIADFYYNRAMAYFEKQTYAESWKDLTKSKELGAIPDPGFIKDLKAALGKDTPE